MDTRSLFDTLAHQEQPPTSVDVNRAVAAGGAIRRRHRITVVAVSALSACLSVTVAWLGLPQPRQWDGVTVAAPTGPSATATATTEPSSARFKAMKKKYPPVGRIASIPEIPIWMWLSRPASDRKSLVLCESLAACAGFPPLTAKEFARTQGATLGVMNAEQMRALHPDATEKELRGLIQEQARESDSEKIFFGIARGAVHAMKAVTPDGREVSGGVERSVGAGLGVWAVKYPPGVTAATLVFTDANGRTLQRIKGG
ncbi:hypothetical protein [Streptosporangium sp. NBC_01469]|uniref:hypothetical protein n=1 Tax=Streptosporangium sp. NBC_01469 TaxID=2903898 RepID=UPI002E2C2E37|nr:hypothetical protein [Streptosporangium sp. NBC_01469]